MQQEKSKQLPYKLIENSAEVKENKYTKIEIGEQVCGEVTNNKSSFCEKNTHLKVRQTKNSDSCETIFMKVGECEQVAVYKTVNFELEQNKHSINNETIYLNLNPISNDNKSPSCISSDSRSRKCSNILNNEISRKGISSPESVDSNKNSFCCGSLSDSGIASAKFSMVISLIKLLIAVLVFFKSTGEDETNTKMLVFCGGVYALCYLHCARKLINGIEKEVRDKFIAWIGFSVMSILLLFSGAIYILLFSWDELKEIYKEPTAGCQTLGLVFLLVVIGCVLIYCTRIVLLLWNSLHVEENSLKGSCLQFMCHFCNSCALSFNSFSRAVSH